MGVWLALVVSYLCYQPAVSGDFLMDDFHNIGTMSIGIDTADDLREFLFSPGAGPVGRPISRLSFLINDYAWPAEAASFKHTNLMLHLLCGLALYAFVLRLLPRLSVPINVVPYVALAGTSLWLLHPFNISTTMYVVQRMTQLAALFMLLSCWAYVVFRPRVDSAEDGSLAKLTAAVGVPGVLAILSKENAAVLPALLLLIERIAFSTTPRTRQFRAWEAVCLWLPSALVVLGLVLVPLVGSGYENRTFSISERLLTQPVILFDYLHHIVTFSTFGLGIYHDDQVTYSSLLATPVLISLVALAIAVIFAWRCRRRFPIVALGVGWFLIGHLVESTTVPLELYFEHRNYLPMMFVLIGGVWGLIKLFQLANAKTVGYAFGLMLALNVMAMFQTQSMARVWGNSDELVLLMATEHPDSPRAFRSLIRWMELYNQREQALNKLDRAFAEQFPEDISLPLMSVDITCNMGSEHRYDLSALADEMERYQFTDGYFPTAESLVDKLREGLCPELVDPLTRMLENTVKLDVKVNEARKRASKALRLNARWLMDRGDFRRARDNLHRAYEFNPGATIAFELTELWIRVGEFESALAWLERTESHERSNRHPLRPDLSKSFRDKRAQLQQLIEAQETVSQKIESR